MTGSNPSGPIAAPDTAALVHDKVLELLLEEKPGLILDVPAGAGAFAVRARKRGYEVQCGDIDRSRFHVDGLECAQLDLNQSWPYDAHTFDYVVSIEALEHLENPWHVAREANRVMKMGGKFFLTTPNVLSLKSRLSYLLYGYPNYFHYMVDQDRQGARELPVDHINPIGFLELRHILSRHGLQIEAIEANRLLKRFSPGYRLLKLVLQTRGRSHTHNDAAKAEVRQALLSDPLLFGEILIVKSRKVAEA